MKRILCLVLSVLLVFGLCACENKGNMQEENEGNIDTPQVEDVTENTESQEESENQTDEPSKEGDVLYEDDSVKISLSSVDLQESGTDNAYMFVTMLVQNKIDEMLELDFDTATINSFLTKTWNELDIDGNQTEELDLLFKAEDVAANNLKSLDDIKEIQFRTSINCDSWDDSKKFPITIYPNEDRNYEIVGYELQEGNVTIIDNEMMTLVYKSNYVEFGKTINVEYYVLGKGDQHCSLYIKQANVGDKELAGATVMTPSFINVYPQKEYHDSFAIWASEDIVSESNEFSFTFEIYSDDVGLVDTVESPMFEITKD